MITWNSLPYFAFVSIGFALWALFCSWGAHRLVANSSELKQKVLFVNLQMGASIVVFSAFIALLWFNLERPPFKTMGETRLWYSLFLLIVGWMTWLKTHYSGVLALSIVMSAVFMIINIVKPEIHTKELMPALDSLWFIPHVVVYMFAYALIGCAFLVVINEGIAHRWHYNRKALEHCDRLVWQGIALLTMGMIMGALWAKQAWGDYWSWDPKETWAAITWVMGLIYIHMRLRQKVNQRMAYILVLLIFLVFQICWYGINYLPAAQNSVHVYSQN